MRRVDQATGFISTIAGTGTRGYSGEAATATTANLDRPVGIAVDGAGNVYIADDSNHRIRMLQAGTGRLFTVAGSETVGSVNGGGFSGDASIATTARLSFPVGVAVSPTGTLFIADYYNYRVRKVSSPAPAGVLSTIAGTGTYGYNGEGIATSAMLRSPYDTAVDASGNVYISDYYSYRIRKVTPSGAISTFAGTGAQGFSGDGGQATSAAMSSPRGLTVDGAGNLYVADTANHRIRRISPAGIITTVAGNGTSGFTGDGGPATSARLSSPNAVAVDGNGALYIADSGNSRIRKVAAGTGIISTFAGGGSGDDGGAATAAFLGSVKGVAVDASGNVYLGDERSPANRVRKVEGSGVITTVAILRSIEIVKVDAVGDVYVADRSDRRIRKISVATAAVTTVAGNGLSAGIALGDGGAATSGGLSFPYGVSVDAAGNLYIADWSDNRVRKVTMPAPVVPPSNLTLQRYGPTGVILNWTAAPGATSYIVKRGTSAGTMTAYAGGLTTTSAYIAGTKNTRYYFTVAAVFSGVESASANTVAISLTTTAARGDLDGDGASDLLVYRGASGNWFSRNSANAYTIGAGTWNLQWGAPGDVPMNGDFDRDGRIDPTIFRPSTGQWFILYSSTGYNAAQYGYLEWGAVGDVPFAADFDGDGYCDIGVFRASSGYWYLRLSSQGWTPGAGASTFAWGAAGDVPITGDMDGDGKADIGVFRPTTGQWFFLYSSINYDASQYGYFEWGASGDINLTADFDGDARGDIGVYRPSTGQWFLRLSSLGYSASQYGYFAWGAGGDLPKVGDFDGDGYGDVTVYRPTSGSWFILYSSRSYDPAQAGAFGWGASGDTALPTN